MPSLWRGEEVKKNLFYFLIGFASCFLITSFINKQIELNQAISVTITLITYLFLWFVLGIALGISVDILNKVKFK